MINKIEIFLLACLESILMWIDRMVVKNGLMSKLLMVLFFIGYGFWFLCRSVIGVFKKKTCK